MKPDLKRRYRLAHLVDLLPIIIHQMGDIGTAEFEPQVPREIISKLIDAALADPQLPRPNPTQAFWQSPAHPKVSKAQSPELPAQCDFAVIGSGATGCSVAKNLLDNLPPNSQATVTVLEARALTSGATGRNGGHLVSPYPFEYDSLEKTLGQDEATKCARFANRTLETMYSLAGTDEELASAAEVRRVRSITGFFHQDGFDAAKAGIARYEEIVPDERGDSEVCGSQQQTRVSYHHQTTHPRHRSKR